MNLIRASSSEIGKLEYERKIDSLIHEFVIPERENFEKSLLEEYANCFEAGFQSIQIIIDFIMEKNASTALHIADILIKNEYPDLYDAEHSGCLTDEESFEISMIRDDVVNELGAEYGCLNFSYILQGSIEVLEKNGLYAVISSRRNEFDRVKCVVCDCQNILIDRLNREQVEAFLGESMYSNHMSLKREEVSA